ncbi:MULTISPECIES: hypothetical protein [Enterobacter]|uniref:hypothetical protein n=1 Tax=Enterobacter TaxID=547 RepID=UPI0006276A88|nr:MULTISPECIES: hypothetical protein [Enterobacter]MDU4337687.1 hypothetical protein [Streptococcus mitis]QJP78095.1 hypothetical protein HJI43_20740 [Enterobacter cloacae]AOQ01281.1 hypothetical protein BFV65_17250 [Enterobacter hormaechei subsp. hoffmannii]EKK5414880.1 hypothetical protein [Enterobacter hormaechei]EKW1333877.1 hypothetical protein [Enterobacter hormaechei]
MSTRAEIKDGAQFDVLRRGVVYTEVLGWVDMGHARGSDIMELKSQFIAGELSGKPSYMVMYRQDMHFVKFNSQFGVGKFSRWEIKRGRSTEDINRIMLAMMMNTAARFEGLQSLRAFSWYTDSGFSGEDLVSDLFGFHRAIMPGRYGYRLKPVSYDAAVRRWDHYGAIGSHKNRGFRPILFPDPEDPCVRHQPYTVNLPHFMTWLKPWDDFSSGNVKVITDNGTSLGYTGVK